MFCLHFPNFKWILFAKTKSSGFSISCTLYHLNNTFSLPKRNKLCFVTKIVGTFRFRPPNTFLCYAFRKRRKRENRLDSVCTCAFTGKHFLIPLRLWLRFGLGLEYTVGTCVTAWSVGVMGAYHRKHFSRCFSKCVYIRIYVYGIKTLSFNFLIK